MKRLILVVPLLALGLAGCRDDAGSSEPSGPGASVQHQVDDIESTLDSIESELNAG